MDKKGLRLVPNSTQKSVPTDLKKDVSNGARPWSGGGRGGFSRGGNGSGGSGLSAHKPEPTRSKPQHNQQRFQGGSFGNKRPQQRGGGVYYQSECGGGGNTVASATGLESVISDELDDGIEPELGSVFVQGTKKQNLNHLLNFHYTRTGTDQRGSTRACNSFGGGRTRNGGSNPDHGRWITTEKHKYNKEHYLQANCQFLVKVDGDYTKYLNNPDTLVDWDLIEQINIQVNDVPSCPICLYPALAAKATRCGHVFCWPCILHYLALSDERWRKCPICYEAVHKQHLKSVVMIAHPVFPVNEHITFNLMKRLKGSLTAYPINHSESPRAQSPSSPQSSKATQFLHTVSDVRDNSAIHCKLVLAASDDVLKIIERERNDLLLQKLELVNAELNPEVCFVDEAIELLNERENQVLLTKNTPENSTNEDKQFKFIQENLDTLANVGVLKSLHDNSEEGTLEENSLSDELGGLNLAEVPSGSKVSEGAQSEMNCVQNGVKTFYFYQASDGQHIYLHAINARMLENTYGSLEFAPHTISGKILEKETGSITEQLRNRVRYLQHLPLTCQIEVAEIDLGIPDVSSDTIDEFRAQLNSRQKRRNLRNRSERLREKRILEHENRQLGRCLASSPMYTTNLHLDSPNHFPSVETSVALALVESNSSAVDGRFRSDSERSETGNRSSRGSSPSSSFFGSVGGSSVASGCAGGWWAGSLGADGVDDMKGKEVKCVTQPGPSFAKMLLKPKKSQSSPWPILSEAKPSAIKTDGSKASGSSSKQHNNRNCASEDSEVESEDYIPAPAYNKSFSISIAMALEKAAMQNDIKGSNENGHQSAGGKKKKKAKQKVLFATSMSFTGH